MAPKHRSTEAPKHRSTEAPNSKHERLAFRLSDILIRLNRGERIDVEKLADGYHVSQRTIQRDLNERLCFLFFTEAGPRHYQLDTRQQNQLNNAEIQRIARFAGIQDLLPEIDRRFFHTQLQKSIVVKGFAYENIQSKKAEFDLITDAIKQGQYIQFTYRKVGRQTEKYYQLAPYHLVNKNGIWYVVGLDNGKQKTYCFSQISQLEQCTTTFTIDEDLREQIRQTDSIYYGNHIEEITVKVNARVAGYFQRRKLLPNQEITQRFNDGSLLISCHKVNPMEVMPIVQYWIPHIRIISPVEWQGKLESTIKDYLIHSI